MRVDKDLLHLVERLDEQVGTLQAALSSNRRIGIAVGIVMTELRIADTAAFRALRRLSMDTNRKLRDVAEDVIERGARAAGLRHPAGLDGLDRLDGLDGLDGLDRLDEGWAGSAETQA